VSEVWRYSDFSIHPSHPHLLVSILEDHTDPTPSAVITKLCLIDTQKKSVSVLAEGADFYNAPRFSPNGSTLAWTQWNHPDMPWEGGSVHIAAVVTSRSDAGEVQVKLGSITKVAGEAGTVAANYPFWTPAGATLHFLCDQSGFANPWVWSIQGGVRPALHAPIREEFGEPAWRLGASYAASIEEDTTVLVARRGGRAVLYVLRDGVAEEIGAPYTLAYHLRRVGAGQVVFIAKTATTDAEIVLLTLGTEDKASVAASFPKFETLYTSGGDASPLKPELFSLPEAVAIEGPTGPVHTVYWPPHNPEYAGSDTDERPPCVFAAHGGPTGEHNGSLDLEIQYYTSRGWAWVSHVHRSHSSMCLTKSSVRGKLRWLLRVRSRIHRASGWWMGSGRCSRHDRCRVGAIIRPECQGRSEEACHPRRVEWGIHGPCHARGQRSSGCIHCWHELLRYF
jgi:dipeptidyl aminopeptidase/acylaminoacyl peptidase